MVVFTLNLTSNENTFKYNFSKEFLEKSFEIGLIKLDGSLEIANINSSNNQFAYQKLKNGVNNNPWPEDIITIPEGNYDDMESLINEIKNQLQINDKNFFTMKLNDDDKVILTIEKGYKINFTTPNSIAKMLGFQNKIFGSGEHVGSDDFEIPFIENIFLKCNLIDDSYLNNNQFNSIFRFKNESEIEIVQNPIIYHKIDTKPNKIVLDLVDINNNLINFSNIDIFVDLHLKEL